MSKRVCTGCRAIYDPRTTGARAGRCPTCSRTRNRARGSREERGYGAAHQATRAAHQARTDAGEVLICWRCLLPVVGAWHHPALVPPLARRAPDTPHTTLRGSPRGPGEAPPMITITPDDTTTTLITHKRATLHLDLTDTTTPE